MATSTSVRGLLAIAVNKLTALGRERTKGLRRRVRDRAIGSAIGRRLIRLAGQKGPGITLLVLADDFDRVVELSGVADFLRSYMVAALDWDDVVRFYRRQAQRLRELVPPRKRGPGE